MRILTFTTLFPNREQPEHGIFVLNRIRRLPQVAGVSVRVVAPRPWFPWSWPMFGRYAGYARIPQEEEIQGILVSHPAYPVIPKIGMTLAPILLALGTLPTLRRMIRSGEDFDLIDAHYFYPDGVAAVMLGWLLAKPVTITARGTDLNLIPGHVWSRRWIRWAARRAQGLITVCHALKEVLVGLGIPPEQVMVLRNGVDLERFRPLEREGLRARLGLTRRTMLAVGHLIERKGYPLVIQALAQLPEVDLLIVGEGEARQALGQLAETLGVAPRIRWLGAVSQELLPEYYNAADLLVLASSREGWANVLLEAMACGTPVIASPVWGTPEIVTDPAAGVLMTEISVAALLEAHARLLANHPTREQTRRFAEGFSWDATTQGQVELFHRILGPSQPP